MSKKPNILWVFADQMRAQAMSCAGDPNVATPNLDRLFSEGFNFPNAISGTPWCAPFRGCMLTGQYPHNSSVPGNHSSLDINKPTIANVMKENGYRTSWIGKWHLDGNRPGLDLSLEENSERLRMIPRERRGGFDDWWGYENNNRPFDCYVHTDYHGKLERQRLPGYETDALTDILIHWLKDRLTTEPEQPLFASMSVQPPHNPYVAPADNMAKHNPANLKLRPNVPAIDRVVTRASRDLAGYYAAIERFDWNIGRLRDALHELGIADNTYIFFFSDHGDMLGSHGQFGKSSPWEESIRIPFIIGGPSREHQIAKQFDDVVNHVDIAPTTLGLCGINVPEWMEGFDYSYRITGQTPTSPSPDSAYISMVVPSSVGFAVDRPFRGIVTRDGWKYVVLEGQPWLMFDLNEDPYEQANLAYIQYFSRQRKILHDQLVNWIETTGDSFAVPEIASPS